MPILGIRKEDRRSNRSHHSKLAPGGFLLGVGKRIRCFFRMVPDSRDTHHMDPINLAKGGKNNSCIHQPVPVQPKGTL
ncbi:AAEL000995-PA [Aedes aegypti]|uniref:AAEL000995-PA n=1 Tax=Aedes aegypti TaxID=7159 RepID=Q17MJ6_AEDAE|nr:AAEL000995-PA [Aedes aegypti]